MEGGVEWCGMDEKSMGRGKEGCALLISLRIWEHRHMDGRDLG